MSRILIVDDDATARETLLAQLDGEGYELELAENGPQALHLAERFLPDVILLDVMMPGMDGFEVCRRMRSLPQLAEVPILILTALDDRGSLLRGIQSGADDFLSKPLDRQELVSRLRTITRLNRYRTLMNQREDLRRMAERAVSAQEEERLRISRELHDDLGQSLTTHMLTLRGLQDDLGGADPSLQETLQALHDQTREISVKVRSLAQDLRPPVLDALGLAAAMEACCAEFARRSQMPVEFEADPSLPALPDVYTITLYRILQEALTNVVKHAGASRAWVELSLEDGVSLTVQDNGRGLVQKDAGTGGLGLAGMNERLTLVGGRLTFRSNPGHGTIVTARLPLPFPGAPSAAEAS